MEQLFCTSYVDQKCLIMLVFYGLLLFEFALGLGILVTFFLLSHSLYGLVRLIYTKLIFNGIFNVIYHIHSH